MDFFDDVYWGNTVRAYAIAAAIAVGTLLGGMLLRTILRRKIKQLSTQTDTWLDDVVADAIGATKFWTILVVSIYVGTMKLWVDPALRYSLRTIAVIVIVLQFGFWLTGAITFWYEDFKRRKIEAGDNSSVGTVGLVSLVARMVIWLVVVLLVLDNVGVDITALVAGLGIGGIAVALAVQNVLKDLLASISIALDKPFEVGDYIVVKDVGGTVEHIGLKTTRVRAGVGEELVYPNGELLNSVIRNFRRMEARRNTMALRVDYQSPADKVAKIPGILEAIVTAREDLRFDRAHCKTLGPDAIDVEMVYWVKVPDFALHMRLLQEINFEILERFEAEGIHLAYPTSTVYQRAN